MPDDFPDAAYGNIHKQVAAFSTGNESVPRGEFSGAWNAVAYRFLACTEHDAAFTHSIGAAGTSPPPSERYVQERELFNFFVSGLSVLESVAYGLHAAAALVRPTDFPMTTEKELEQVTLGGTRQRFQFAFPNERLTTVLMGLTSSDELQDWRHARNVLAHRAHPGRAYKLSGPVAWRLGDIPIDSRTTASRRVWLANTLRALLDAAHTFASSQLVERSP